MKITYIVITCEPYLKTRAELVNQTWRKFVNCNDEFYFLSSIAVPEKNILGYGDPDDYKSAALKKISFFKNNNFNSDWIFICDDDTFVFPDRLRKLLSEYNAAEEICVCEYTQFCSACRRTKFKIDFAYNYPNGGAGIAISNPLFYKYKNYLNSIKNPKYTPYTENGDITMGLWSRLMKFENFVDRHELLSHYNPDHPKHKNTDLKQIVTMHHCNEKHFEMLHSVLTNTS